MNLHGLARLVQEAIDGDPPAEILARCGDYYSPYYHLLHLLALELGGPCVELGVETGRGSHAMLLAGAEVWGVDHTRRPEISILLKEHPAGFHFLERDSLPVPTPIRELGAAVRVLHVDTEHSFSMAREEFRAYEPLLASPSVVCFDDTHAQGSEVGHFVATLRRPTIFDDRLHECGYAVMLL